jgi:hypothetical protein
MVNNKLFEMLSFEFFTTRLRAVGLGEDGWSRKERILGITTK